jgi:hypothetical protein
MSQEGLHDDRFNQFPTDVYPVVSVLNATSPRPFQDKLADVTGYFLHCRSVPYDGEALALLVDSGSSPYEQDQDSTGR